MLKYVPKYLSSFTEGLVLLFRHCKQCVVVWTRKYGCGCIAARSRLRLRPPPLLGYRTPVTMSKASNEPRDDLHVLVEGPKCAHHHAKGPRVGAGVGTGCAECRRKCSSSAQYAWLGRVCRTWELLEEHVFGTGKGLRSFPGHGGFIWRCGGRGGLVVVEAVVWRCKHNISFTAKP